MILVWFSAFFFFPRVCLPALGGKQSTERSRVQLQLLPGRCQHWGECWNVRRTLTGFWVGSGLKNYLSVMLEISLLTENAGAWLFS